MTISDAAAGNVCVLLTSKTRVPILASSLMAAVLDGLIRWLKGAVQDSFFWSLCSLFWFKFFKRLHWELVKWQISEGDASVSHKKAITYFACFRCAVAAYG